MYRTKNLNPRSLQYVHVRNVHICNGLSRSSTAAYAPSPGRDTSGLRDVRAASYLNVWDGGKDP